MRRVGQNGPFGAGIVGAVSCALAAIAPPPAKSADAFAISGEHRIRYESLSGQFRRDTAGGDQILAQRTLIKAVYDVGRLGWTVEGIDARAHLQDSGSLVNTTLSDAADILQAYGELDLGAVLGAGSAANVRGGRFTLNLGARRLVARNGFRNTVNAFTGVDAAVATARGDRLEAFFAFPVDRRPADRAGLLADRAELDRESDGVRLYGAIGSTKRAFWGSGEFYVFRFEESDGAARRTRNRRLTTIGGRAFRAPARGAVDFEIEAAGQFGSARASAAPADEADLDHRAFVLHAEIGAVLDHGWKPRAALQYDHASGDRDPDDSRSGRFEPLFGARAFDLSSTGIYGPVFRANLSSPGVRFSASPTGKLDAFLMYRAYLLASSRDEWVGAGLADPTGASGRFLGHVIEAHAGWRAADHLKIDAGVSYLTEGRFRRDAPDAPRQGAATWAYFQTVFSF